MIAGPAAASGSRDLVAALIGMLSAGCRWRAEKTIERFVEDRAVGFVLDQRRRQRLLHSFARSRPAAATAFIASIDSATEILTPASRSAAMKLTS